MNKNIEINRNKLKLVETIVWLLYDYCMTMNFFKQWTKFNNK